jgi:perosamine synthetase
MQIPFHRPYITDDEINSMAEAARNGWLTMGKKTEEFENRFKNYLEANHGIAVNSCTAALHVALKCTDIKEKDEVLLPTISHASTAETIVYFNAKPVFVDIERDTHLINVAKIEDKITKKTRAIMPVHYAGQTADMNAILDIAKRHKLYIIEDAAHAFPSKYKGRYVGTFGDATCFSFYATKTITTGEGGMITTDNADWAKRMRILRLHGVTRDAWERENAENFWEYDVVEPGFKYNPTDIGAAMGIEQLKKADYMHNMRTRIAEKYDKAFKNNEGLILYKINKDCDTSWHLYPLKLNLDHLSINRNRFVAELKLRNIFASVHFIPIYRFSYYKNLVNNVKDYPESEWVFERTFSLPIFPAMTDNEINYVIENVLNIVRIYKR